MKRQVVLTQSAQTKLNKLLYYLEVNWSDKVKEKFIKRLDKAVDIIQERPEIFPRSNIKQGLHKCVVSKQTNLYYTFDNSKIYILTIFDNRQDPKKLKKQIKGTKT